MDIKSPKDVLARKLNTLKNNLELNNMEINSLFSADDITISKSDSKLTEMISIISKYRKESKFNKPGRLRFS